MKHLFTLFFTLLGVGLMAQADRSMVKSYPAKASKGELLGQITALRDIPARTDFSTVKAEKLFEKRNYIFGNKLNNPNPQPQNGDPLAKKAPAQYRGDQPEIIPVFNFEGLRDPSGVYPPDPNGDIGKNHYVQMVNSSNNSWLQVWDKETGNSVYGPSLSSAIWSQVGTGSVGDPIVQYDQDAERWVIMELRDFNFSSTQLLIAISDDSDPTGGWKAYVMQTLGFPDFPKLYVWNNAYFITVNELYNGNKCAGYAINRADLLAGEPEFDVFRFELPNYMGVSFQPATGADWEGGPPPPPGSPGYIFRLYDDAWDGGQDHLESWEINLDWNDVTLSHVDGPSIMVTEPFETRVCFGGIFSFDCIEQPNTGVRIAAAENIIMHRAPYRNFGDHETVVLNHISDVSNDVGDGGDAQVRWYELRKTGASGWQIFQQGTYAPDVQTNRTYGTICLDETGSIGLGYTGVSESIYPGLYLTGRRTADPLGEMPLKEHTLALGGASHNQNRWGDYSSMCVDPYDGNTFWFTGEYQPSNSVVWSTRIGAFKIPRDTYDVKPTLITAPIASPLLGNNEQVRVKIINNGLMPSSPMTVTLVFENNIVVTDNINGSIPSGGFIEHTFSQTVAMPVPGKNYKFRVITSWAPDQFTKNDTLNVLIQKLTSFDASVAGRYNLPGFVCGSETNFGLILRNASAVPMQSAKINWRVNTQPWQVYDWTGDLAPGARDTIPLYTTGIINGLNVLQGYSSQPNGIQDERVNNDSITVKFYGNTDGTYLTAESQTTSGSLHWELRSLTNEVLAQGDISAQQPNAQICSDNNDCYRVALKANSFNWKGHFTLKTIFGNVLVEITDATTTEQIFNICTPVRVQRDFGALALLNPVSGPGLTATEPVTIQLRNFGLTNQSNVRVGYRVDGGTWHTEVLPGPYNPGQTIQHTFSTTENLSTVGNAYNFQISAAVPGDQIHGNDTAYATVSNRYLRELELLQIDNGNSCNDTAYATINLEVQNNGVGDEHTFDVAYTLNGVAQPNIPSNTLLAASGESGVIQLFISGLKSGLNTIQLDIVNVDGMGADQLPGNNGGSINFEINPNNQLLDIAFSTDSKPEETTWDIIDAQGAIIQSGGPYEGALDFYVDYACLETDSCYTFRLHDSGGDGMENGYIAVAIGGYSIFEYSGDNFGFEKSIPFCATALCADLVMTANVTPTTGIGIIDGKIEAVVTGGTPPYFYFLNGGDLQTTPIFSELGPGPYILTCLDAQGCSQEIALSLGTVSATEPATRAVLTVSPNPTIGVAHVSLTEAGKANNALCEVYDAQGKKIQTNRMLRWDNTLHGNIALDKFPAGHYYLRVVGLGRVYATRVLKQ